MSIAGLLRHHLLLQGTNTKKTTVYPFQSPKELHQSTKTLVRTDPAVTIGLEFDCVRYVTVVGHGTNGASSVWQGILRQYSSRFILDIAKRILGCCSAMSGRHFLALPFRSSKQHILEISRVSFRLATSILNERGRRDPDCYNQ